MGNAARNFHITLDDSSGTPVDLSAYFKSADINDDIGLEDDTTFGASVVAKSFAATLTEGGFSLSAPYHATLNTHLKGLKGLTATSTFTLGPQGSTGGYEKVTGECRMKSLKRSGTVDGLLMIEAEFIYDGTVTETTF